MASIPIQNETEYTLTDNMADQIIRDVQEYFGETVRSIRVQYGIERHAYNARTGEVRYAFSPNDFGLIDTTTSLPETYFHTADVPTIDDDAEGILLPTAFGDATREEDEEDEEEDEDRRETSLESLEEELNEEDDENEEDFPELDDQFEDADDEDSFMYDDDDYN